ncbi:hypothetical protein OG596_11415 [Streptomyces sp. NBC_01102]|uniref:hypothetical protein n=1 Tax=Streptomyces sp. NBC_01102 TaxID=2903749 RepID=UPI0038684299|nr:hypothetical protein OG596_11415 [Streptomyces sp. NBC_01102]
MADLFEVRAEGVAGEAPTAGLPDAGGVAGTFELVPDRAHDGVAEGDERLGHAVGGPVLVEDVGITVKQPASNFAGDPRTTG